MCAVAGGAFASTRGSVARIARVKKCVVTPNRKGRGSEKAHRGASAATHLAAVTPVACMASGGAPSGVRARAKVATTRSTRRTRGVECRARAARLLGDLNAAELRNRENDDYDVECNRKKRSVPLDVSLPMGKKSVKVCCFFLDSISTLSVEMEKKATRNEPARSSVEAPHDDTSRLVCVVAEALRETFRLGVRRAFPQSHPRVFKRLEPSLARCLPSRRPSARPRLSRRASGAVASRRAPPRASPSPRPRL